MQIEQKAIHFLTALMDVYRDEESRELPALDKMEFPDDLTEDFTAMVMAMHTICQTLAGYDGDLIDFTHMLNKLVVQHLMEGKERDGDG